MYRIKILAFVSLFESFKPTITPNMFHYLFIQVIEGLILFPRDLDFFQSLYDSFNKHSILWAFYTFQFFCC
jgi:hypothetical protein